VNLIFFYNREVNHILENLISYIHILILISIMMFYEE